MAIPRLREVGRRGVLGFDLEAKPGAYWYGDATTRLITAFGWKWVGETRVHSLVLCEDGRWKADSGRLYTDEWAYNLFRLELERAGLVFGHNIRRYDLPLFNSGLQRRHMPVLQPIWNSDTLKDGPKRNGLAASLANYAAMYDLGEDKLGMTQHDWEQANQHHPGGIALARARVESDVLLQEKLRDKMLELGHLGEPKKWSPR